jgi:hypothetical protein
MPSSLTWLDVSAEHQRRVRDMIRLFEEPGTRDELGVGPVRDAFSDLLFPGTSTIQTRARYFLFVPWHFQDAQRRGARGEQLLQRVDRSERQLIERFRKAGDVEGLIGRQAGAKVKTLPSTIYWNGLDRWGVLTSSMSQRAVAQLASASADGDDEAPSGPPDPWDPTLPPAPPGFPSEDSGGFDLTFEEARWLRERILQAAHGRLLAHLVNGPEIIGADAPWQEPSAGTASAAIQTILEHARRFSLTLHGAALLYNLLVSEAYEAKGLSQIEEPVERYRSDLADWAAAMHAEPVQEWDWRAFWLTVAEGNPRVPELARWFVQAWVAGTTEVELAKIADNPGLRHMVEQRVTKLRKGKSVLANPKLLGLWGGSSGASPLEYRWGTVRTLVLDIQEGLGRAGA